ncbi:FxSxx-COOH cyclophane-containing RiPP peptide [Saccharothrix obliqua]|uniref:FxSxx-COOH cyclophane-containing RiPP peptide n=1 Tax=Saccharothrix obliqua TaxID=2861747 RepID=UPI001C5DB987|nr:FxSxx-COOH cyclophane-containing RiPP peptide [Saccharothrix obliqua]MBW4718175.1 FXSXX-COOH protein [Saccharothrix obliqua]
MADDGVLESELLDLADLSPQDLDEVAAPALRASLRRILAERQASDQYAAFQSSL